MAGDRRVLRCLGREPRENVSSLPEARRRRSAVIADQPADFAGRGRRGSIFLQPRLRLKAKAWPMEAQTFLTPRKQGSQRIPSRIGLTSDFRFLSSSVAAQPLWGIRGQKFRSSKLP
jgi:hypothetical protein